MKRTSNRAVAGGASVQQSKNWVTFGLLYPPPQKSGAGRGSISVWPSDTEQRVALIKDRLHDGYKLLDIACELFALEYMLAPKLIRRVLLKQLEDEEQASEKRLHTHRVYSAKNLANGYEPNEQDEAQERLRIARSVKRKTPYLSESVQTSLVHFRQLHAGVATPQTESKMPAYPSRATERLLLQTVDDNTLLEASIRAVVYLHSSVAGLEQWQADLGVSSAQAARMLLPMYRGKQPLTLAQASRPIMTFIFACIPNWQDDLAEQDQRVMRPLYIKLVQEMRIAGKLPKGL